MEVKAIDIAQLIGGQIIGDGEVVVNSPAGIEEAQENQITFLGNPKYEKYLYSTNAGIVIIPNELELRGGSDTTFIKVKDVYLALAQLFKAFTPQSEIKPGISDKASAQPGALISMKAQIDDFVIIEEGAVIGDGVHICGHVFIGKHVVIGDGTKIHPGARIYEHSEIGKNCVIFANAVIGSDGFGYASNEKGHFVKIPHMGKVIIEDDVEIGSNSTIDRGSTSNTIIKSGVKIDNLVHIAHNVIIGEHSALAAQTGIAGSAVIGSHCRFGGQTGIAGHVTIAENTEVQAQSGIASSIKVKGSRLFGTPAFNYISYIKSFTIFKKLPELWKRLNHLEKVVDKITSSK